MVSDSHGGLDRLWWKTQASSPPTSRDIDSWSNRTLWRLGRLKVFIGSSTEQKPLAEDLVKFALENFRESLQPVPWYEHWPGGEFTLETLLKIAKETDASMLVLHADDVVCVRGDAVGAPRDNLIFEAGLFIATHGRCRARLLVPSEPGSGRVKRPTDIEGLTTHTYEWSTGATFAASGLPAAARQMCTQLVSLGPRTNRHEVARAAIEAPANRSKVKVNELLTGRSSGVSPHSELWAVVLPIPQLRYHPQGGPLNVTPDGGFERKVYIGLPESTGTYRLQLVLVDSAGARQFHQYLKEANETRTYRGLSALPPSARILDNICVTRS